MKKTVLLLLPLLALSSCGGDNTPTEIITPKENLTVYLDYSEASTLNYRVKVHNASFNKEFDHSNPRNKFFKFEIG